MMKIDDVPSYFEMVGFRPCGLRPFGEYPVGSVVLGNPKEAKGAWEPMNGHENLNPGSGIDK